MHTHECTHKNMPRHMHTHAHMQYTHGHTHTHIHVYILDKLNMIFKFKFECQLMKFINVRAMPRLNMKETSNFSITYRYDTFPFSLPVSWGQRKCVKAGLEVTSLIWQLVSFR